MLALNAKAIAFYQAQGARCTGRVEIEEVAYRYEDLVFEIPTSISSPGFP